MSTLVWFVVAALAGLGGAMLLAADYRKRTAHRRQRRRWARMRNWRFTDAETELPERWRQGPLAHGEPGQLRRVASGRLRTTGSDRQAHIVDHERRGEVTAIVVAVRCSGSAEGPGPVVELWLPSEPFPTDPGLAMLGPVGGRYAFSTDIAATHPLILPELIEAADEVGDDVPVVWLEQGWVLAAAPATAAPDRWERLLRALGTIADELDPAPEAAQTEGEGAAGR